MICTAVSQEFQTPRPISAFAGRYFIRGVLVSGRRLSKLPAAAGRQCFGNYMNRMVDTMIRPAEGLVFLNGKKPHILRKMLEYQALRLNIHKSNRTGFGNKRQKVKFSPLDSSVLPFMQIVQQTIIILQDHCLDLA